MRKALVLAMLLLIPGIAGAQQIGGTVTDQTVVYALPREQVLPIAADPAVDDSLFRSARVSSDTIPAGFYWNIWFDVQSDADDRAEVQQHAIAFDYTPATTWVRGMLEFRLADGVWSSPWADGFGVDGRYFLCYGMYAPAEATKWRFRVYAGDRDQEISYRFSAERASSSDCARDAENDGGTLGTGSGGDFGPFNIYVDRSQGEQAQIAIAIRDHACEDGDIVSVFIGDGYGDRAVFTNTEIFNDWEERLVTVRAGYYYQVRAVAVNGTQEKRGRNCPATGGVFPDINSGEMRVRSNYSSEVSSWTAPGGSESAGIINIHPR